MVSGPGLGYLFASVACIGSFLLPLRLLRPNSPIDPFECQLHISLGCFLGCWLSQAFLQLNDSLVPGGHTVFQFSRFGLLSGLMLALAMSIQLLGISKIGTPLSQGISAAVAVVTSALWSELFREDYPHVNYRFAGLPILVVGIAILSVPEAFALLLKPDQAPKYRRPLLDDEERKEAEEEGTTLEAQGGIQTTLRQQQDPLRVQLLRWQDEVMYMNNRTQGALLSAAAGLLFGSYLVPLMYAPDREHGLTFLPAFGTAFIVTSPVLMLLRSVAPYSWTLGESYWHPYLKEALVLCLSCGMLWTLGNIFLLAAVDRLGYGISIALSQLSFVISVGWLITYTGESMDVSKWAVYGAGASMVAAGTSLLLFSQ